MNQAFPEPVIINESGLTDEEVKQLRDMGFEVPEQGSDEWLEERLGLPTASRIKDVVARTRYGKPYTGYYTLLYQLAVERVTGQIRRFSSKYTDWGINHEDDAADFYEALTNQEVQTCGFIRCEDMDSGASPDRLVGDEGLLQIKCPNTATHFQYMTAKDKDGNPVCPPDYYDQMQWELKVTGRKWNDFMSFDPEAGEGNEAFIIRVHRDDEYIKVMEERVSAFLVEVEKLVQQIKDYEIGDSYGEIKA